MGKPPAAKVFWLLFLGLILGSAWLAGCRPETPGQPRRIPVREREFRLAAPADQVRIYYLTKDRRYFVPVTFKIGPTREAPRVAVEKLLAGAPRELLAAPFPPDVKLRALYREGDRVVVDLTGEVLQIQKREAARRAFEALVWTLAEFPEVKTVKILVRGSCLANVAGFSLEEPLAPPPYLNPLSQEKTGRPATLYFADQFGAYLVPVTLFLPEGSNPLAAVAGILAAGPPAESGLGPTVWPGTKVLRIEEKKGIVAVDFSREVLAYGGGSAWELTFVNALVFTFTEFPQVNGVQILIEGKKHPFLPEGSAAARPLRRPRELNPAAL